MDRFPSRGRHPLRMALRRFAVLALLAAPAAAQVKTQPLFIIERSKNANVVHYDAQLGADGRLDPKEPVIAYWVMAAEDGRREELNWIESKVYGLRTEPAPSGDGYNMILLAYPDREITVRQEGDAFRAELVVDGRPSVLEKIYIDASEGLTGPTVHQIELYGKDPQTGEKHFEKITPK